MSGSEEPIYFDNAATTPVLPEVLDAMRPYFCDRFGNPSSLYSLGRQARSAVDRARRQVADALGAEPDEIFFTSGGSEADNWALRGAALLGRAAARSAAARSAAARSAAARSDGNRNSGTGCHAGIGCGPDVCHIVSTQFEHHAVLHTLRALQRDGLGVTLLKPDADGFIHPQDLEAALRPDTVLVSVMTANNEVGTIQPIPQLAAICRRRGILFHTDAVQAAGHIPLPVHEWGVDLLSVSAHKFHGPKGVGALYCRKGLRLPNLIEGGAQERDRRGGTENVPGIVGMGEALSIACARMDRDAAHVRALRSRLIDGLRPIGGVRLNGPRGDRRPGGGLPICNLPGIVNVRFDGVESEPLLMLLDLSGICASAGSACAAGSVEPSHVLKALGLSDREAASSLRFSLSDQNTAREVDTVCSVTARQVARLRELTKKTGSGANP